MADIFSKKKRSQIMARIRGKGTSVEKALTIVLWELGLRPELHCSSLPGKPDFVLRRHKVVMFTNGCFWHGHKNCPRAALPSTNKTFWERKIEGNVCRDERQRRILRKMGWKVLTFWTCKPPTSRMVAARLKRAGVNPSGHKRVPSQKLNLTGYYRRA